VKLESVQNWLVEEQERLGKKHIDILEHLQLTVRADIVRVWAWGKREPDRDLYRFGDGANFDEAIQDLISKFECTEKKVEELRNNARELLRRASEMERSLDK
jgi:hypothetical protein